MAGCRAVILPMRTVRIAGMMRVLGGSSQPDRRRQRWLCREGHQGDVKDQGQGGNQCGRLPAPDPHVSVTDHCPCLDLHAAGSTADVVPGRPPRRESFLSCRRATIRLPANATRATTVRRALPLRPASHPASPPPTRRATDACSRRER